MISTPKKKTGKRVRVARLEKHSGSHEFRIKRVYEKILPEDGLTFLVDRLWPRGVKKTALGSTEWLRDVAPSQDLRKWFDHDPKKWTDFRKRYRAELKENTSAWKPLLEAVKRGDVALLFASREPAINHAIVLKEFLEQKIPGRG
jgi:uncharacterized protein YeaO (DUF488 family)